MTTVFIDLMELLRGIIEMKSISDSIGASTEEGLA